MKNAFTLIELLVVIAVLAFLGAIILVVFTNSLRGNNKAQIIALIKQNGQASLETMDKTIRNADRVVCPTFASPTDTTVYSNTIVTVNQGTYTMYRAVAPRVAGDTSTNNRSCMTDADTTKPTNGCIIRDTPLLPSSQPQGADPNLYIRDFENTVCLNPLTSPQILTDTNPQTGVSIQCMGNDCTIPANQVFKRDRSTGFKDKVTIQFLANPGVGAPAALSGQIDAVTFQTTVELR